MRQTRFTHALLPVLVLVFGFPVVGYQGAAAQVTLAGVEAFDGSFRLETGEVVNGGYFVEAGEIRWLYMDTARLQKVALFERVGDAKLRSVLPSGTVEINFIAGSDGGYDKLTWLEGGRTLVGERVFPHTSREVHFTSADGTELSGRLLVPRCEGPHPVVVSVHGSGPVNRYGGTFHTFFLQYGVAVLAYDKRGYTSDTAAWREPDLAQMSADAAAGVDFVARLAGVDVDAIGLWGSSQGGWVVPPAALAAPETDYMILRAGAAVSEAETNLHEVLQEARDDGLAGLDLDYALALRREIYDLAMRREPKSAADALVAPYLDEPWYRRAFGDGPISTLWSDQRWGWMQRNLAVASAPAVAQFKGPVLWFLGERDEAVPLVATRAALERAFARAAGQDHQIVVLDDAPHSFMIPTGGRGFRYAPGFFSYTADWMSRHGFTDPACWGSAPARF